MTDAKLLTLPESHGLNETVCAASYDKLVARDNVHPLVVVAVLMPAGYGELRDKKGFPRRHVDFRPMLLEVLDGQRAGQAREWLAQAIESRTGAKSLPLDFGDRDEESRAEFLAGLIRDHAAEKEWSDEQLADEWRSHFGGPVHPGYVEFAKCRSPLRLLEFAMAKGALPDEPVGGKASPGDDEPAPDEENGAEQTEQPTDIGSKRRVRDVNLPEPAGAK